ncbi:MAG: CD225/dispanin family protein [Nitrospirae bacterium]|nr:CD225/dispanin family protein [Nitrospirota bacterium]
MPYRVDEYVPDYLVWSILATLFCCLPIGIVAIVYSSQVNTRLRAGEIVEARENSRKAKMWCLIAVGSWGVVVVLAIVAAILGASFMP